MLHGIGCNFVTRVTIIRGDGEVYLFSAGDFKIYKNWINSKSRVKRRKRKYGSSDSCEDTHRAMTRDSSRDAIAEGRKRYDGAEVLNLSLLVTPFRRLFLRARAEMRSKFARWITAGHYSKRKSPCKEQDNKNHPARRLCGLIIYRHDPKWARDPKVDNRSKSVPKRKKKRKNTSPFSAQEVNEARVDLEKALSRLAIPSALHSQQFEHNPPLPSSSFPRWISWVSLFLSFPCNGDARKRFIARFIISINWRCLRSLKSKLL